MAHFPPMSPPTTPSLAARSLGGIRASLRALAPEAPGRAPAVAGRFPLMDAIRAIAALLIFAYHASLRIDVPSWSREFFDAMTIGVPVFFVVSGFLLYRPFAVSHLRGEASPTVFAFGWRRFLRIVPAFWLALTVVLVFGAERTSGRDALELFAFAQVYDPALILSGIPQAWSLDCEVVYYAMLPLIALGVRSAAAGRDAKGRLQLEIVGLVALLVISEAYKGWFTTFGHIDNTRERVFLFQPAWNLDLFVAGMALALWSARREVAGTTDRLAAFVTRRGSLLWIAAAALYALIVVLSDAYYDNAGNFAYHAVRLACAVCLLLPVVFGRPGDGVVRRFLGQRWMLSLGVISYAIYLYHGNVLTQVFRLDLAGLPGPVRTAVLLIVALAVTVGLSIASWVFLERPALSLKRLVPDRRAVPPTGSLAPAEQPVPARAS